MLDIMVLSFVAHGWQKEGFEMIIIPIAIVVVAGLFTVAAALAGK